MTDWPTTYPRARQRLIPINHSDGGMLQPTRGLIPHVQMGRSSLFGWFSDPSAEVSSHLWLSTAGEFEQYVAFNDKAWAQGVGNAHWISCECAGRDTDDYTDIQVQRLGELFAWGIREFGWRAQITDSTNGYGLGTHRMGGAAWGGHSCPGDTRANRRGDILAVALGRPSSPPPTKQEVVMTPEQDARFTKALEGIPAAVSSALAREMKGLVTRDGAGNEVRMADVAIGTVGQALGLLVLRSSFEWQRDDALATTLREASTRLGELTTVVNRLSAGAGGPVDLSPILTELHALRTQLNQLTLTAAPGHVST